MGRGAEPPTHPILQMYLDAESTADFVCFFELSCSVIKQECGYDPRPLLVQLQCDFSRAREGLLLRQEGLARGCQGRDEIFRGIILARGCLFKQDCGYDTRPLAPTRREQNPCTRQKEPFQGKLQSRLLAMGASMAPPRQVQKRSSTKGTFSGSKKDLLYSTILYSTLLYSTLLYSTLQYYPILYYTLLYYPILYYTLLDTWTLWL